MDVIFCYLCALVIIWMTINKIRVNSKSKETQMNMCKIQVILYLISVNSY